MRGRYTKAKLKKEILQEARVLGLHRGAVELIADRVSDEVDQWVSARASITEADLDRVTAARIRKYNPDLAYWYRNRSKII